MMDEFEETKLPLMQNLLNLLENSGFDIIDSGDGETNLEDSAMSIPFIMMEVDPDEMISESHRLMALLASVGIEVQESNVDEDPHIEASYDPANSVALIALVNVNDKLLSGGKVHYFH